MRRVNAPEKSQTELKRVWDKVMSAEMSFDYTSKMNRDGESIYRRIAEQFRTDTSGFNTKAASEKLASLGIAGIRYLDGTSRLRTEDQGTSNYVVFNENDIEITHRNGTPVTPAERKEAMQNPAPGEKRFMAEDESPQGRAKARQRARLTPYNPEEDARPEQIDIASLNRNAEAVRLVVVDESGCLRCRRPVPKYVACDKQRLDI